jgi:hypothetical protein
LLAEPLPLSRAEFRHPQAEFSGALGRRRALEAGHFCYPIMVNDTWLDSLRAEHGFQTLLDDARERSQRASALFVEVDGPELLGQA